ncbi:unnamed protein product [Ranitomeya imitator]|uniref:Uncharacterized protein n=1 Tax=Ranitomeya imitator TaxID=111125 RepID=A0ABN9LZD4_9NEOB|nr:unnamed protein product [Ranitomeya imitator]
MCLPMLFATFRSQECIAVSRDDDIAVSRDRYVIISRDRNAWTAHRSKRRGMDIKQMKTFVAEELKGLKQEHRMLSLHIGACESIMKKKTKQDFQELLKTEHSLLEGFDIRECINIIEEHINRQVSPIESLRLLCLLSLTENGLITKDYRSLKTQYLQSYGPEHLLTFSNLKRVGLLTEQAPGETLTAVESRVSKLVTDKAVGKLTDAFSSLAKKSHFRGISKRLGLVSNLLYQTCESLQRAQRMQSRFFSVLPTRLVGHVTAGAYSDHDSEPESDGPLDLESPGYQTTVDSLIEAVNQSLQVDEEPTTSHLDNAVSFKRTKRPHRVFANHPEFQDIVR